VVFQNFNNAVTGDDNRNQMLLVKSTDGGASFTGTTTPVWELPSLSDERPGHLADQFWQWAALNPASGRVTTIHMRALPG
jgi:hypothetical protein